MSVPHGEQLSCSEHFTAKRQQRNARVSLTRLPNTFDGGRCIERSSTPLESSSVIFIIAKDNQHINQQKIKLGGIDYILNVDCKLKPGQPFDIFDESGKLVEDLVIDELNFTVAENGEVIAQSSNTRAFPCDQKTDGPEQCYCAVSETVVPFEIINSVHSNCCKSELSLCRAAGNTREQDSQIFEHCFNHETCECCSKSLLKYDTKTCEITCDADMPGSGLKEDDDDISDENLLSLCQSAGSFVEAKHETISNFAKPDSKSHHSIVEQDENIDTCIAHHRVEENCCETELSGLSRSEYLAHKNLLPMCQTAAGESHFDDSDSSSQVRGFEPAGNLDNIRDVQCVENTDKTDFSCFSPTSNTTFNMLQLSPECSDQISIDALGVDRALSCEIVEDYLSDWQLIEQMSAKIIELENVKAGMLELTTVPASDSKSHASFDLGKVAHFEVRVEKIQQLENELRIRAEGLQLEENDLCRREKLVIERKKKLEQLTLNLKIKDIEARLAEVSKQINAISVNSKPSRTKGSSCALEQTSSSRLLIKRPGDSLLDTDSVESGRCEPKKTVSGKSLPTWKFTKRAIAGARKIKYDKTSKGNCCKERRETKESIETANSFEKTESEVRECAGERVSLFTQLASWFEPTMLNSSQLPTSFVH